MPNTSYFNKTRYNSGGISSVGDAALSPQFSIGTIGVFVVPIYTGQSDVQTNQTFFGSSSLAPNYFGVALTSDHQVFGAGGGYVLPIYSGTSQLTQSLSHIIIGTSQGPHVNRNATSIKWNHPILVGTGIVLPPSYVGVATIARHIAIGTSGSNVVPVFSGLSNITPIRIAVITSNGRATGPLYNSSGNLFNLSAYTLSSDGLFTLPIYHGNVSVAKKPIIVSIAINDYPSLRKYDITFWIVTSYSDTIDM